jgi:alkylated DNA nucleotide flippase Atl1
MAYSDVAEYVGIRSARQVGRIMARQGGAVPWQRVVHADGSFADQVALRQASLLRAEGVPFRGERVDMKAARWDGG